MGKYMDQAVELLQETAVKFGKLADEIARNIQEEGFDEANRAYQTAAELDILASRLSGEEKVVEGKCKADSDCAKVVVGGVSLRGNMQFEVEINGEWEKGHRENSQYGQIFFSQTSSSHILTEGYNGRVTFPLRMDE